MGANQEPLDPQGHKIKGNDHQLKRLSIVQQFLLVNTLENVWKTVWRVCILMLGYQRVKGALV